MHWIHAASDIAVPMLMTLGAQFKHDTPPRIRTKGRLSSCFLRVYCA